MISVNIERKSNSICGFTVKNHGSSKVCAAVSVLTLNTVNSIEAMTDEVFSYDYKPEGGFLKWERSGNDPKASLLLDTMVLGLKSIEETYSNEIKIKDDKHD